MTDYDREYQKGDFVKFNVIDRQNVVDSLDYTELVKALRYCGDMKNKDCSGCTYAVKCGKYFMSSVTLDAADAIEKLRKPLWISVEERLPENDQVVYVCGILNAVTWTDLASFYADTWHLYVVPKRGKVNVTHWTPLPQPPEIGRVKDLSRPRLSLEK